MPRSDAELAQWEVQRDLGAELLQSVTEMCEGTTARSTARHPEVFRELMEGY
ncbi:MAG: hypothetical protein RL318_429 [Fibrobacterota bacterium]|jgi:hypothetical protein